MNTFQVTVILTEEPASYKPDITTNEVELVRRDVKTIGIDDIRYIATEAYRTPNNEVSRKTLVLSGNKITSEAQQASLKIFEEPPARVQIILLLPPGTRLLDTVLSRVVVEVEQIELKSKVFSEWLAKSYSDRLAEVDNRIKKKDIVWIQSILNGLRWSVLTQSKIVVEHGTEIQLVLENLQTRGASNKMLLEHLALQLPLTD